MPRSRRMWQMKSNPVELVVVDSLLQRSGLSRQTLSVDTGGVAKLGSVV
jgi:hypothetical protein